MAPAAPTCRGLPVRVAKLLRQIDAVLRRALARAVVSSYQAHIGQARSLWHAIWRGFHRSLIAHSPTKSPSGMRP